MADTKKMMSHLCILKVHNRSFCTPEGTKAMIYRAKIDDLTSHHSELMSSTQQKQESSLDSFILSLDMFQLTSELVVVCSSSSL